MSSKQFQREEENVQLPDISIDQKLNNDSILKAKVPHQEVKPTELAINDRAAIAKNNWIKNARLYDKRRLQLNAAQILKAPHPKKKKINTSALEKTDLPMETELELGCQGAALPNATFHSFYERMQQDIAQGQNDDPYFNCCKMLMPGDD